jgi:hypothetical protein
MTLPVAFRTFVVINLLPVLHAGCLSSQTLRKNFDEEKRFITMQNDRNQEWFDFLKSIRAAIAIGYTAKAPWLAWSQIQSPDAD